MGCCNSGPEQVSAIGPSFIDIPLLKPAQPTQTTTTTNYYTIDTPKRKPSYEGGIIEHSTFSVADAPETEPQMKQNFNECFSHIEVNTFQNMPIMSIQSHLSLPQFDAVQQNSSHSFDEYMRYYNQVVTPILTPLKNMKIQDETCLSILLDQ